MDGLTDRVQRVDEKTGSFLSYKYSSEVMQYGHYKISKMAHFSYILLLITILPGALKYWAQVHLEDLFEIFQKMVWLI